MVVVRSPYPNAEIASIDAEAARSAEGVVAVFTGGELMDDWKTPLPDIWPVTDDMLELPHYPLAVTAVQILSATASRSSLPRVARTRSTPPS